MEHSRFNLAGSESAPKQSKAAASNAVSAERKKNLILAGVGALLLVGAGYLIYVNFFAVPGAPADAATPATEATFQEAAAHQPPEQDSQPLPEPGGGKRPN